MFFFFPFSLLSAGNVLLLRNSLHLSLDEPEVSLQKLLSLLAEKLIDSNSNVQVLYFSFSSPFLTIASLCFQDFQF